MNALGFGNNPRLFANHRRVIMIETPVAYVFSVRGWSLSHRLKPIKLTVETGGHT